MKTLIVTTAIVVLAGTTAAFAGQALNSNGERKHDWASSLQVQSPTQELDREPTGSTNENLGSGPVSVTRTPDGNGGHFIIFSQRNAAGELEILRERHER